MALAVAALFACVLRAWPAEAPVVRPLVLLGVVSYAGYRYLRTAGFETGRMRRVRLIGAVSIAGWCAGLGVELGAALAGVGDATWVEPTTAGLGLLTMLVGIVGMLSLPAAPQTAAGQFRLALDGLLVGLCLFGLVWQFVLRGRLTHVDSVTAGGSVVVLSGSLVAGLAVALLLLLTTGLGRATVVTAVTLGFALVTGATLYRVSALLHGVEHPNPITGGVLMLGALALAASAGLPGPQRSGPRASTPAQLMPYVPLVLLFAVALREDLSGRPMEPVLTGLTSGAIAVVLIRQYLSMRVDRSTDTVARLGGDEFAILLPDAGPDVAVEVAERILERINEPVSVRDGAEVRVRASIGIALAERGDADPEVLQRDADLALYDAKEEAATASG